ncbi:MAG TPA: acyltransferase domain-containing protein, partial [Kofleriaceae bacterium]
GHSLGEYVAATVAGVMTFDEGLAAVAAQARMLRERCAGCLLSVLAAPALFDQRRDVFDGLALAGVNFAGNFVVSGAPARLDAAQAALDRLGHVAVRLPVRHGFHGPLVDAIRGELIAHAAQIRPRPARLPIYSACYAGVLPPATTERWADYLWDVVREPIRFAELMAHAFSAPDDLYFVDLSASGSFANFLKHSYGARFRAAPVINQFGHNTATLDRLRHELSGPSLRV